VGQTYQRAIAYVLCPSACGGSDLNLDWHDRIIARDEFEAENDRSATAIAGLLHDAFSDCSPRFELRRGARRLVPQGHYTPSKPSQCITEVTMRMQEIVLAREEILQQSHWTIAASKRLIARVDQLRTEVSRARGAPGVLAPLTRGQVR
jgi:hypothetical protein